MGSKVDLEFEYAPSKWSRRFKTPEEVLNHHCEFVKQESDSNRRDFKCTLDIRYGSGPRAKLDIYHNDLPNDAPLFVYIHGGYWQELNKELSSYCVRPLIKHGYKVIIVGYDLCPQITLENLVEQIKVAGRFIMKYADDNGSRFINFAGHSAGAHLSTFLLTKEFYSTITNSNRIKTFYLLAGVYDLKDIVLIDCVNKNNILSLSEQNYKHLSPIYQAQQFAKANVQIIVGEHESQVFQRQSYEFYDKIKDVVGGGSVEFKLMENYDHFNIVEDLAKEDYTITQSILRDLRD